MAFDRSEIDTDPSQTLSNPMQEKFARTRAQGNTLRKCCKVAGYAHESQNAGSRLAAEPHVRARIEFLVRENAEKADAQRAARSEALVTNFKSSDITREFLVQELLENLSLARQAGELKTANESLKLLADVVGITMTGKKADKDPNRGNLRDDPENRYGEPIDLQSLDRLTDRMGEFTGDEPAEEAAGPAESPERVVSALSDQRSNASARGLERFVVTDLEPIPLVAPIPRD